MTRNRNEYRPHFTHRLATAIVAIAWLGAAPIGGCSREQDPAPQVAAPRPTLRECMFASNNTKAIILQLKDVQRGDTILGDGDSRTRRSS
jgi:hypothetical protein